MNSETSGHFDISDPFEVRLHLLHRICDEGNGYAAWLAYRLCRETHHEIPSWVTVYIDSAAEFVLDQYTGNSAELVEKLRLSKPVQSRLAAMGPKSSSKKMEEWQLIVKAMLPSLVDEYVSEHGVPKQTAIKALAPALQFTGEQWTKLRDAYEKSASD